jgi:hypothetical protein
VYRISEDVFKSLDGQAENYPSAECEDKGRHFSVQSGSYLICFCLFSSTVEMNNDMTCKHTTI